MEKSEEKEGVWSAVLAACEQRVQSASERLESLQSDLESEGKSTAGDKHETGRAMIQLEMESAVTALNASMRLRAALESREPAHGEVVRWGSWFGTESGSFLVCVALGAIETPAGRVHAISEESPMAAAALHAQARAGESIEVNGRAHRVLFVA